MTVPKFIKPFLILFCLLPVACAPLGIAVGAGAGAAAFREGGVKVAASDARIQIAINDLWFKYDVETFSNLDLSVNDGRVLVTGVVGDPDKRVEAIRLAWQPKGVKQVINEVRVAEPSSFSTYAKDTWILTRLRAALTVDGGVKSFNYSMDAVQGTVYLMGVAQGQVELDRVLEVSRTIPGVKQVVHYVKIREPEPEE